MQITSSRLNFNTKRDDPRELSRIFMHSKFLPYIKGETEATLLESLLATVIISISLSEPVKGWSSGSEKICFCQMKKSVFINFNIRAKPDGLVKTSRLLKNSNGFTLANLITCIATIGILVTVGIQWFINTNTHQRNQLAFRYSPK